MRCWSDFADFEATVPNLSEEDDLTPFSLLNSVAVDGTETRLLVESMMVANNQGVPFFEGPNSMVTPQRRNGGHNSSGKSVG